MGTDALKDLRAWQRQQASEQDKALRDARRAKKTIVDLDAKIDAALEGLVAAIAKLEATGLRRTQCAALLDLGPDEQSRVALARRRAGARRDPATAEAKPESIR